ncbi:tautomerase family protein [Polaromonas sp.]|uniref:tautomerase family protein n=1 Tax=Polaromonas sp. TaxID=1869339 RepID=UPI003263AC50
MTFNPAKEFFMPLVRISLPQTTPSAEVAAVSDTIHRAMVETFNVPELDRFQVIHRHGHEELVCTPEYLGVNHSGAVVFVQITCAPGRSLEMKKALYARVASDISRVSSFSAADVIINLVESSRENWSFGLGIAQYSQ